VLLASKTKTKRQRIVPISGRLKAILEMRRNDPDGEPHKATTHVFGNEIGQPSRSKNGLEARLQASQDSRPASA